MNIGNLPPMHGNLLRENDDDIDIMIYPSELGAQHFQTHPVLQRTMQIITSYKKQGTARLVVASERTRRLVISCVFCVKWVRWGVGGWGVGGWVDGWVGMLTFIGLAHLRDATLLHVLFNLHNYVMLRYCTFSSIYTTWCYVDWGGGVGCGWGGC